MRQAKLSEKLLLAVSVLIVSCGSDHRVSPWGAEGGLGLRQLFAPPDLAAEIKRIDAETTSLGLTLTQEIRASLPNHEGEALIRGYDGRDPLGRPVHAVRVATPRGVVLAVGPIDAADTRRDQATELVPAMVRAESGASAYRSGTDLNGDKRIDVVLRNEAGVLAIWHVDPRGGAPYPIDMHAPPLRPTDLDQDGFVDLEGEAPIDPRDAIGPRFIDVASFDGAGYSDRTDGARAYHARLAEPPAAELPGPAPRPEVRLRAALERAFHAALAGKLRKDVLEAIDREAVPDGLRASFDRHRARISELLPTRSE